MCLFFSLPKNSTASFKKYSCKICVLQACYTPFPFRQKEKRRQSCLWERLRFLSFCSSSRVVTSTWKWDSFYNVLYLWLLIYERGSQKWKQFLLFSFFFKLRHEDHICSLNQSTEFQYSTTSNSRPFVFKIRLDLASQPHLMYIPSIPAMSFCILSWHPYFLQAAVFLLHSMQNAFYQYDVLYSGGSCICFACVRNSQCKISVLALKGVSGMLLKQK